MGSGSDLTGIVVADKYELVRSIGQGGMGAVYEARHSRTGKRCAVKLLRSSELSGDGEVVKRFFREARASGLIESEHVVAAFDSGIDSASRIYYVMEYLQGEDLAHLLRRVGSLGVKAAMKILAQAASGVASAHALGVIHRDLKPGNLFLTQSNDGEVRVKILDFGVAKVRMEIFEESSDSLTRGGALLGTPQYMSPEQIKRASAIDESADVWSLGVVLFECLTGRLPWANVEYVGELLAAILTQPVTPVQSLAPWIPEELARLVHHALARDPAKRLPNAAVLRDELRRLVGGDLRLHRDELAAPSEHERSTSGAPFALADTVRPEVIAVPAPGPPKRARSSKATLWAAAAAIAATGGSFAWKRSESAPTRAVAELGPTALPEGRFPEGGGPRSQVEHLRLGVDAPGAEVSVDGVPSVVEDGTIEISGVVGSVHIVAVRRAGVTSAHRVAIASDGLVPAQLSESPFRPSPASRPLPPRKPSTPSPAVIPRSVGAPEPSASPVDLSLKFE